MSKAKRSKKRRGKASLQRYEESRRKAIREYAAERRAHDIAARCPQGVLDKSGKLCKVVPYLYSSSAECAPEVCSAVLDFYLQCLLAICFMPHLIMAGT
mmetsp:Transcript_18450/g.26816  ORF Transcript_18450/g.26816 Transcript_18450/m.26816 type:complete len:99 (-) Transcript_18450:493-789(-)